MSYALECRNVNKSYGQYRAVTDVSLVVPRGSFFSILGPSGCGKTSLLRMIAGLGEPDSGQIFINQKLMRGVSANQRPVNMVFQQLALFPMMTVFENIAYGLKCRKFTKQQIAAKVEDVLNRIGLTGSELKKINELSGGQKQRVAIARCLVLEPEILLLDEPLGALDLKLREQMKIELKKLQHQFGTTFVYITHDQGEALVMSDQVAVMRAGRLEQVDSPRVLYQNPETPFVASFVGDNNHWQGKVQQVGLDAVEVVTDNGFVLKAPVYTGVKVGDGVGVFVRPEQLRILREDSVSHLFNRVTGVVENVVFNGGNSDAWINVFKQEVKMTLSPDIEMTKGQKISLGWPIHQSQIFPSSIYS